MPVGGGLFIMKSFDQQHQSSSHVDAKRNQATESSADETNWEKYVNSRMRKGTFLIAKVRSSIKGHYQTRSGDTTSSRHTSTTIESV